jgi:hypothetical protein
MRIKQTLKAHWKLIVLPPVVVLILVIILFILTKGRADRPFVYAIN